ncbi:hypothetical protein BC832DRAFT_145174 [Gaertneriomyces semiglobifer]|nr:hypothetical protein BC832DRAFT_145174 [Gaertneriomyces semiglobifer]
MAVSQHTIENVASLASCSVLLLAYHWYLVRSVRRTPERTVYGLTRAARRIWVLSIMKNKNEILAVQTLRNWVMASSFLATTASVVVLSILALVGSLAADWQPSTMDSPISYAVTFVTDPWFGYRLAVVLIDFMFAFFCFAQSVRFFNHVGMICNVNATELPEPVTSRTIQNYLQPSPKQVSSILNRGCFYYTSGMRFYYLSFPAIAWFWGPISLGVATAFITLVLRVVDFHVAEFEGNDESDDDEEPESRTFMGKLWHRKRPTAKRHKHRQPSDNIEHSSPDDMNASERRIAEMQMLD